MEEITFDYMKPEHIDMMLEVEQQCFSAPWSRAMFETELTNSLALYFVALANERVVGYIGAWQIINEGHITNVAVVPEYRRSGLATTMLERLMHVMRENSFSYMTLEVRKSNIAAITLYKRMGFTIEGERKRYYEDNGEDAYIMSRDI